MSGHPPLRVVVVHWNQPESCLGTVARFLDRELAVRVTVVDNGSSADALDALPARSGPVLAPVRSGSGLRYRVARLAVRAGLIEHARPPKGSERRDVTLGLHRLRHRFGTDVVREHGIAVGQAALRHASPQTTARYAKEREHQVAVFVRALRRG